MQPSRFQRMPLQYSNVASSHGGAIYIDSFGRLLFNETTKKAFYNNSAAFGGAIYAKNNACITFKGNSMVNFTANSAFSLWRCHVYL